MVKNEVQFMIIVQLQGFIVSSDQPRTMSDQAMLCLTYFRSLL